MPRLPLAVPVVALCLGLAVLPACGGSSLGYDAANPEAPPPSGLPTAVSTPGVAIATYDSDVIGAADKPATFSSKCKLTPVSPDDHAFASKAGAKHVRVKVPQLETPLYGLLALCKLPASAKGPGSRAHRIQVPEQYVVATEGGRISVVFEEVDGAQGQHSFTSWQLFLSRAPFPGDDATAAGTAARLAAGAAPTPAPAAPAAAAPPQDAKP